MAARSVIIVSPSFPPARGGVADHTRCLAAELAQFADVTVFTSRGAASQTAYRVAAEVEFWNHPREWSERLLRLVEKNAILWQYVPHLYGRGGMNLGLGEVFRKFRERGNRQLVLAHEIAAPFSIWPHRIAYAWAQRKQWEVILRCIDSIGISTEAWWNQWTQRRPTAAQKLWLAPSPSTIPRVDLSDGERAAKKETLRLPKGVPVLGFFGDQSRPKRLDWVMAAWEQSARGENGCALLTIGSSPEVPLPDDSKMLFCPLGYLPAPEVSASLQLIDVLLLPYLDGASERRTSFMAGLSHGCPIVTTRGSNTGPSLRQAAFVESVSARDFAGFCGRAHGLIKNSSRRAELREQGEAAYRARFDWPVLIDRVRRILWPGA